MEDQNELAKAFAGFMESQCTVVAELSARITALQEYLQAHDPEFWGTFQPLLDAARKQIDNPFDWWKRSKDGKSH